jgi:hypothetical protein
MEPWAECLQDWEANHSERTVIEESRRFAKDEFIKQLVGVNLSTQVEFKEGTG